jgi:hypothetical protein
MRTSVSGDPAVSQAVVGSQSAPVGCRLLGGVLARCKSSSTCLCICSTRFTKDFRVARTDMAPVKPTAATASTSPSSVSSSTCSWVRARLPGEGVSTRRSSCSTRACNVESELLAATVRRVCVRSNFAPSSRYGTEDAAFRDVEPPHPISFCAPAGWAAGVTRTAHGTRPKLMLPLPYGPAAPSTSCAPAAAAIARGYASAAEPR